MNILLVGDDNIKTLFLTDWSLIRPAKDLSTRVTAKNWDVSFYQHPNRRMDLVAHDYTLAYDIYSLAVCMLEILLGTPFISIDPANGQSILSPDFRRRAIDLDEKLVDGDYNNAEKILSNPLLVKEVLESFAREKLPWMAGQTLSQLVIDSLRGFDGQFPIRKQERKNVVDDDVDETRINEGVKYIQNVVLVLEGIKI
jgi:serine/threonine protein kinase